MIVVCLVMMIVVSWELTLFVLILLPAAGYVMGVVGQKAKTQVAQSTADVGHNPCHRRGDTLRITHHKGI